MTKVLSVASECAPLVKTGGLADVVGALPGALAPFGVQMRVLLPGYPGVLAGLSKSKVVLKDADLFGGTAKVLASNVSGLDLLVLDAPHLFDRGGSPYLDDAGRDFADNPERFAALSWVAMVIARDGVGGWQPDVVHCHDWQAGLAPYYLRQQGVDVPSVLTIHNIAFHGIAGAEKLIGLRLDPADFGEAGFEFWGNISALKAGLQFATKLTTVSPTYARELTTEEFGMGLDGVLRNREGDLQGILNGIDLDVWNPATDENIATYKTARRKGRAKAALLQELGLPAADGPLCVVVSRLSHQKGLDVLLEALPALVDHGGQLALLGSGDKTLETAFLRATEHQNVAVKIGYDEALSHRMMAGADAILVPSRFEPCGLTQLYGLRYGTIPVVATTGGLADTVIDASPMAMRSGVATGVQFAPVTAHALAGALTRVRGLYSDQTAWAQLQKNAMKQDAGWAASAGEYAALYDGLIDGA
ncbi:MAG: glycogen synthase GlgA [Boseongicola sp.]|nr:MAG: glycogen synthase GlgA [Boseongicola sp.]